MQRPKLSKLPAVPLLVSALANQIFQLLITSLKLLLLPQKLSQTIVIHQLQVFLNFAMRL
jgi:hypothetical protein